MTLKRDEAARAASARDTESPEVCMSKQSPEVDPWLGTIRNDNRDYSHDGGGPSDWPDELARLDKVCVFAACASHRSRTRHRVVAKAFRNWRWRKVVANAARRSLVSFRGKMDHARITAIAALNVWRCLMVQRQRHENELSFVRNQTAKDACALRESSVDLMVERLVHTKLRAAQREVETATAGETETKRRCALRVAAAELERDAHCEQAERERLRADVATAEGIAAARRVAESVSADAERRIRVLAQDAAAEREWLREALEKAWAEVIAFRRLAGARNADASLHEHLVSVAGSAWADELAKALVPGNTNMLGKGTTSTFRGHGRGGVLAVSNGAPLDKTSSNTSPNKSTGKSPNKRKGSKTETETSAPRKVSLHLTKQTQNLRGPGANKPSTVGRVVGLARRDSPKADAKIQPPPLPEATKAAWRAPSGADRSFLTRADRDEDADAARARANARRDGRFGDLSPSTRSKSSPWTPRSVNVSTRAASLLGLVGGVNDESAFGKFLSLPTAPYAVLSLPGVEPALSVGSLNPRKPRATQSAKDARSDLAWENTRARFALSRQAFQAAVEQRLLGEEGEGGGVGDGSTHEQETDQGLPYVVQTPGTHQSSKGKKSTSRAGLTNDAEGGALAIAAIAARRFVLPGDTSDEESVLDGSDSDDNEWLFR